MQKCLSQETAFALTSWTRKDFCHASARPPAECWSCFTQNSPVVIDCAVISSVVSPRVSVHCWICEAVRLCVEPLRSTLNRTVLCERGEAVVFWYFHGTVVPCV